MKTPNGIQQWYGDLPKELQHLVGPEQIVVRADSGEISKDLIRLCTLLHMKNELTSARHTARKAYIRLSSAECEISLCNKKKKLEKKSDKTKSLSLHKVNNILAQARDLNYYDGNAIVKAAENAAGKIEEECERNEALLAGMPKVNLNRVPRKLRNMKKSDLYIELTKALIAREQAKLNIRLFTRENRKEIAAICKRNGWQARVDMFGSHYDSVRLTKMTDRYIYIVNGKEKIAQIAAASLLENAMVKEGT